jgi:hypothetical protein
VLRRELKVVSRQAARPASRQLETDGTATIKFHPPAGGAFDGRLGQRKGELSVQARVFLEENLIKY